jgi:hypothetical protein
MEERLKSIHVFGIDIALKENLWKAAIQVLGQDGAHDIPVKGFFVSKEVAEHFCDAETERWKENHLSNSPAFSAQYIITQLTDEEMETFARFYSWL